MGALGCATHLKPQLRPDDGTGSSKTPRARQRGSKQRELPSPPSPTGSGRAAAAADLLGYRRLRRQWYMLLLEGSHFII